MATERARPTPDGAGRAFLGFTTYERVPCFCAVMPEPYTCHHAPGACENASQERDPNRSVSLSFTDAEGRLLCTRCTANLMLNLQYWEHEQWEAQAESDELWVALADAAPSTVGQAPPAADRP